jgi:hypothetical protein
MNIKHEPFAESTELAKRLIEGAVNDGGSTLNRRTHESLTFSNVYIVGGQEPGIKLGFPGEIVNQELVVLAVAKWIDALPKNVEWIGSWIDDEILYLDAVTIFPLEDGYKMAQCARSRGEKAVYYLNSKNEGCVVPIEEL